ncbi:MAG: L,D-transpeptidase, partial [Limisphaerales bacterium]
MKINHGRARPPGAPGTRAKKDGSAIRSYLLLALFLASCAAPDTQHHIVISTRDQKLALLDRGTLLSTYPVSTSKFG